MPRATLITAWDFLQQNGRDGKEQLCFLVGRIVAENGSGRSAQVTSCVLPLTAATAGYVTLFSHQQTAMILDALEKRGEIALASLHTHGDGGQAGCGPEHSEVDDHGVALTPEDGLWSGIVPYFAAGSPFEFVRQTTFYERLDGEWVRLSREQASERVILHDDTLRVVSV